VFVILGWRASIAHDKGFKFLFLRRESKWVLEWEFTCLIGFGYFLVMAWRYIVIG